MVVSETAPSSGKSPTGLRSRLAEAEERVRRLEAEAAKRSAQEAEELAPLLSALRQTLEGPAGTARPRASGTAAQAAEITRLRSHAAAERGRLQAVNQEAQGALEEALARLVQQKDRRGQTKEARRRAADAQARVCEENAALQGRVAALEAELWHYRGGSGGRFTGCPSDGEDAATNAALREEVVRLQHTLTHRQAIWDAERVEMEEELTALRREVGEEMDRAEASREQLVAARQGADRLRLDLEVARQDRAELQQDVAELEFALQGLRTQHVAVPDLLRRVELRVEGLQDALVAAQAALQAQGGASPPGRRTKRSTKPRSTASTASPMAPLAPGGLLLSGPVDSHSPSGCSASPMSDIPLAANTSAGVCSSCGDAVGLDVVAFRSRVFHAACCVCSICHEPVPPGAGKLVAGRPRHLGCKPLKRRQASRLTAPPPIQLHD